MTTPTEISSNIAAASNVAGKRTAIRDYVHVRDLADAHLRALAHLIENRASVTLNLGTGKGHSVKQVVTTVEQVTGLPVPVEYASRRQGDAPLLIADPAKAERILGWHPKQSSLEWIIQTAWDWNVWQNRHKPETLASLESLAPSA